MSMGLEQAKGIARYVNLHSPWLLYSSDPNSGLELLSSDQDFDGDGMIIHFNRQEQVEKYRCMPFPVVNVASLVLETGFPSVLVDNEEVGRLAFEHLFERGFKSFGFCGFPNHGYSLLRQKGFCAAAQEHGLQIKVYEPPKLDGDSASTDSEETTLAAWLKSLEQPAGVMAANDIRARKLLDTCHRCNINVPEDIAIIGVDNDPLICLTTQPTLSSVSLPFERIGYEAAKLLDRLMYGEVHPERPIIFPPIGVVARGSTDIIAVADRDMARTLHFINQNAAKSIGVDDIAAAVSLNRRTLERRFRRHFGHSLYKELLRRRINLARSFLAETDLPMPEVAKRSGINDAEQLSVIFRRELGIAPRDYRRKFRYTG